MVPAGRRNASRPVDRANLVTQRAAPCDERRRTPCGRSSRSAERSSAGGPASAPPGGSSDESNTWALHLLSCVGGYGPAPAAVVGRADDSLSSARRISIDVYRTPDERFDHLPDYAFEPHYLEQDGLRMHYVDEGSGEPVLVAARRADVGVPLSQGDPEAGRRTRAVSHRTTSASAAPTSRPIRPGTRTTATSRRSRRWRRSSI